MNCRTKKFRIHRLLDSPLNHLSMCLPFSCFSSKPTGQTFIHKNQSWARGPEMLSCLASVRSLNTASRLCARFPKKFRAFQGPRYRPSRLQFYFAFFSRPLLPPLWRGGREWGVARGGVRKEGGKRMYSRLGTRFIKCTTVLTLSPFPPVTHISGWPQAIQAWRVWRMWRAQSVLPP